MKQLIAISILIAFTSLEIVDCAFLSIGNELGIELVEGETDNSEKESEGESYEKKLDEKLVTSHTAEFNQSVQIRKIELDRVLMMRLVYREIVSPPPELT